MDGQEMGGEDRQRPETSLHRDWCLGKDSSVFGLDLIYLTVRLIHHYQSLIRHFLVLLNRAIQVQRTGHFNTGFYRSSFILRTTYPQSSVTPPLAGPTERRPPGM